MSFASYIFFSIENAMFKKHLIKFNFDSGFLMEDIIKFYILFTKNKSGAGVIAQW